MNGSMLFFAVDVTTIVVAALIAARVLISHSRLHAAQLIGLICICSICNVLQGRADYSYWIDPAYRVTVGELGPLLSLARNLTPALFMMLCHALFAAPRRFPLWLTTVVVVQMLLEDPIHGFLPSSWPWVETMTRTTSALLQTAFGVAALAWTLSGWRTDLIEHRRRTRLVVLGVVGLDVIVTGLATRLLVSPTSELSFEVYQASTVASMAITILLLLVLTDGELRTHLEPARTATPRPPTGPDVADVLVELARIMDGGLYLQPRLTLKEIADRVGLPVYRLRRIIHVELGHQNFNAFLHVYRVREACARLSDPELRRTPILTIALEAGYQSINTFNRGFRDVMGVTPSAYRAGSMPSANRPKTT